MRGAGSLSRSPSDPFTPKFLISAARFGFDDHFERTGVVPQVSFVHSEKQDAIALRDKVTAAADEDEFVVVVPNDSNQSARRLRAHQLFPILNARQTVGRRRALRPQVHTTGGTDAQTLSAPHDEARSEERRVGK